jgi:hypothetical protein
MMNTNFNFFTPNTQDFFATSSTNENVFDEKMIYNMNMNNNMSAEKMPCNMANNMNMGSMVMNSMAMNSVAMNSHPTISMSVSMPVFPQESISLDFDTNCSANSSVGTVKSKEKKVPKSVNKAKKLLPPDFQPSNYSIICGNKRKYFNSVGNRRFRILVKMYIQQYLDAPGKLEKSFIVTKVMNIIREAQPVGAFVSLEKDGRWYEVSERTAREKVGSFFRDCLPSEYNSSAKNKIAARKEKQEAVKKGPAGQHDEEISIGSSKSASFYDVDDLRPVPLDI